MYVRGRKLPRCISGSVLGEQKIVKDRSIPVYTDNESSKLRAVAELNGSKIC